MSTPSDRLVEYQRIADTVNIRRNAIQIPFEWTETKGKKNAKEIYKRKYEIKAGVLPPIPNPAQLALQLTAEELGYGGVKLPSLDKFNKTPWDTPPTETIWTVRDAQDYVAEVVGRFPEDLAVFDYSGVYAPRYTVDEREEQQTTYVASRLFSDFDPSTGEMDYTGSAGRYHKFLPPKFSQEPWATFDIDEELTVRSYQLLADPETLFEGEFLEQALGASAQYGLMTYSDANIILSAAKQDGKISIPENMMGPHLAWLNNLDEKLPILQRQALDLMKPRAASLNWREFHVVLPGVIDSYSIADLNAGNTALIRFGESKTEQDQQRVQQFMEDSKWNIGDRDTENLKAAFRFVGLDSTVTANTQVPHKPKAIREHRDTLLRELEAVNEDLPPLVRDEEQVRILLPYLDESGPEGGATLMDDMVKNTIATYAPEKFEPNNAAAREKIYKAAENAFISAGQTRPTDQQKIPILQYIEATKLETLEDLLADRDFEQMVRKAIYDAPRQIWKDSLKGFNERKSTVKKVLSEMELDAGAYDDEQKAQIAERLLATLVPQEIVKYDKFDQAIYSPYVDSVKSAAAWLQNDSVFQSIDKTGKLDEYDPSNLDERVKTLDAILNVRLSYGEELTTAHKTKLLGLLKEYTSLQQAINDPIFQDALNDAVLKLVLPVENTNEAETERLILLRKAIAILTQEGRALANFQGVKLDDKAIAELIDPDQGLITSTMLVEELVGDFQFQYALASSFSIASDLETLTNTTNFKTHLLTPAGRKKIFNQILAAQTAPGESLITWEEFQQSGLENFLITGTDSSGKKFETVADVMANPIFMGLYETKERGAKDRDDLAAHRELNKRDNLIALVTELIAESNIVEDDSSPQFLQHVLEQTIPSIVDYLPFGGIGNKDVLREIVDAALQPGSWLPVYDWREEEYDRVFRSVEFSREHAPPTKIPEYLVGTVGGLPGFKVQELPEFKLEQLQPKVDWLAYERPEFGQYIQEQLQSPGFREGFVEANRPTLDVKGTISDISGFDRKLSLAEAELERLSPPSQLTNALADLKEETAALQAQRQQMARLQETALSRTEAGPRRAELQALRANQQQEKAALDRNIAENQTRMSRLQDRMAMSEAERRVLPGVQAKVAKLRNIIGESPLERQQFIAAVKEARRDRPVVTLGGFYEQELADFERAFQKTPLYAMEQERVAKEQQKREKERVEKEREREQERMKAEQFEEGQRRQQLSGRPMTRFARVRR